jgi:hypothetical protein
MTAQTPAQRQAKHKAAQAALGIKEVRGIMAHVDYHVCIRRDARDTVKSFERIDKETHSEGD